MHLSFFRTLCHSSLSLACRYSQLLHARQESAQAGVAHQRSAREPRGWTAGAATPATWRRSLTVHCSTPPNAETNACETLQTTVTRTDVLLTVLNNYVYPHAATTSLGGYAVPLLTLLATAMPTTCYMKREPVVGHMRKQCVSDTSRSARQ